MYGIQFVHIYGLIKERSLVHYDAQVKLKFQVNYKQLNRVYLQSWDRLGSHLILEKGFYIGRSQTYHVSKNLITSLNRDFQYTPTLCLLFVVPITTCIFIFCFVYHLLMEPDANQLPSLIKCGTSLAGNARQKRALYCPIIINLRQCAPFHRYPPFKQQYCQ